MDGSRGATRRSFLALAALTGSAWLAGYGGALARSSSGRAVPFSYDRLRSRARRMAEDAFRPRPTPAPDIVQRIDFDAVQKIRFRPDAAPWAVRPGGAPIRFFHLHRFAPSPVRIHRVEGGEAREIVYRPGMFERDVPGLADELPEDLGFAGFRVMDPADGPSDWLAFQGASYFRSAGQSDQYGLSARGVAIDTAVEGAEEFPAFTEFWLEDLADVAGGVRIHALLDGPSVTGAYRFDARPGEGVIMDVETSLFFRRAVRRLGLAPLTSMYWFGENEPRRAVDWRPEVHDSDGLALWTGAGERIFRPLTNPPTVRLHSFEDRNPKGFGLVQRDRDFASYQDDGAFYDRRPSLWVEPKGDWGPGSVQLLEIPTDDEIHDNIAAFWSPAGAVTAGDAMRFAYRLHWRDRQPYPPDAVASVVATRTGRGGRPGQARPDASAVRKFVIDFRGGPISEMEPRYDVEAVVSASRGEVSGRYVVRVVGTDIWRAVFDLATSGGMGVDLRCHLRLGDRTLSETWLYHYVPAV
ncbi:glucan biosynthesis protein D [Minwuia thermotolerans]|uniref:Glucan biosynthesis protein D n=2 Tax=Minwuia thermotolerans TaxID=2056226 RepID=A0A2M9FY04_9PROT|nr:glucan biosynthesis protein [Minwuia thermotolerans]PJK28346.1 glucan biosynthesis protein D [Minwuia thermotolerans]